LPIIYSIRGNIRFFSLSRAKPVLKEASAASKERKEVEKEKQRKREKQREEKKRKGGEAEVSKACNYCQI